MGKIFVCSDLHFNHKNILKYEPCRIEMLAMQTDDIKEMNDKIAERWNSVVSKEDIVYCLGDVSFGSFDVRHLNGKRILIKGNHDRSHESMVKDGWDEVHSEFWISGEPSVILTHHPIYIDVISERKPMRCVNIHGHMHSKPSPTDMHICVSLEQINCTPVELSELIKGK